MPEYIEREALLKEFDEIEPDECYDDEHDMWLDCRLSAIQAPTADVVKVVRCAECRHYNPGGCANGFGWCEYYNSGATDDHYCSHGERRLIK